MAASRKMRVHDVGERNSVPERGVPVRGVFESHLTVSDLRGMQLLRVRGAALTRRPTSSRR
jgi:hypothetical protein